MNEEISKEVFTEVAQPTARFAWQHIGEPAVSDILNAMKTAATYPVRKVADNIRNPKGEMSVKKLLRKDQGASSVDISELGLKDFRKIANKYGVDFAITKSQYMDPPKYTVFFKAKDMDAITNVINEYTAKQLRKQENPKPSLLAALQKFKDLVSKIPHKAQERRKEQER